MFRTGTHLPSEIRFLCPHGRLALLQPVPIRATSHLGELARLILIGDLIVRERPPLVPINRPRQQPDHERALTPWTREHTRAHVEHLTLAPPSLAV